MIILEGTRHNFLPEDLLSFTELSGLVSAPAWIGSSELGPAALEITVCPSIDFSFVCRIALNVAHRDYTFSVYAWERDGHCSDFGLRVSDHSETQLSYCDLSNKPTRLMRAVRFANTPTAIEVAVFGRNSSEAPLVIRLCMPVIEEGLFATSPIALGQYRSEDQLAYDRKQNFFEGPMGTVAFLFKPIWSAHELSSEFTPHLLSCSNEDGRHAIEIYADTNNGGGIAARLASGDNESFIRSDVLPQREKLYSIALTWLPPYVSLMVNGFSVGEIEAALPPREKLGEKVYLGKSARGELGSAFGCFEHLRAWNVPLTIYQVRAFAYETAPARFPQFRFSHLYSTYDYSAWPAMLVNYLLRYPNQFQQLPPKWAQDHEKLTEGDFRDDFCRAVGPMESVRVVPEEHADAGRTDVLFTCDEAGTEKRVRVEYKIWGRHDYKEIPEKPLKYFRAGDRRGAVFMINPNQKKGIGDAYREVVRSFRGGCEGIIDLPFGDDNADHFISIHQVQWGQVEVLHVVMDLLR